MLILCPDWRLRAQDRLAGERSLKGFHGLAPTFTDRQKTGDGLALIARTALGGAFAAGLKSRS
jgi:hypothetical protein